MQLRVQTSVVIVLVSAALARAAAPIELELATDRGVQITAPQEWLQLFAGIGIEHVRVRGIEAGDEPRAENRGTPQRPHYRVLGILTSGDRLRLPGGTFTRGDREKLKDYFARLAADGAESLTAPRVQFGLTEKEMTAVLADLAQPIDFETKGQPLRTVIDRLQTKLSQKVAFEGDAEQTIRAAKPVADELRGVSAGTGLAMILRASGLVVWPEKSRGQPVAYRIATGDAGALRQSTLGKRDAMDMTCWPIGWELADAPSRTAPSLFESLNAEIDGYTMEEALAAISPRLKVPVLFDQAALASHQVDPAKIQVKLPRTKTSYKRLIDRVVSQARLGSELRVDESGRPFLWVTR